MDEKPQYSGAINFFMKNKKNIFRSLVTVAIGSLLYTNFNLTYEKNNALNDINKTKKGYEQKIEDMTKETDELIQFKDNKIQKLKENLSNSKPYISRYNREKETNKTLNQKLYNKDNEIKSIKNQLNDYITESNEYLNEKEMINEGLKKEIEKKNNYLASSNEKLDDCNEDIKISKKSLEELSEELLKHQIGHGLKDQGVFCTIKEKLK